MQNSKVKRDSGWASMLYMLLSLLLLTSAFNVPSSQTVIEADFDSFVDNALFVKQPPMNHRADESLFFSHLFSIEEESKDQGSKFLDDLWVGDLFYFKSNTLHLFLSYFQAHLKNFPLRDTDLQLQYCRFLI